MLCQSLCNTPIFSCQEAQWRYAWSPYCKQDSYYIPIHPVIRSLYILLDQTPSNTQWVTVLDLKDLLFCIPIIPESQFLFCLSVDLWTELEQTVFLDDPSPRIQGEFPWALTHFSQGFKWPNHNKWRYPIMCKWSFLFPFSNTGLRSFDSDFNFPNWQKILSLKFPRPSYCLKGYII